MNVIDIKRLPGLEKYQLKEEGITVLKFCYKPGLDVVRTDNGREKRVMLIENAGFLQAKVIIRNEYGVRIGTHVYDNYSVNRGLVNLDDARFHFFLNHSPQPELHIYHGPVSHEVYKCRIDSGEKNPQLPTASLSPLVIAVSWYLYQQTGVPKELFSIA